jgi:hypothetical protein
LGKNGTKLTFFDFVVKKDYVGYVGWKNLESYVEMVAGLPINEQNNDQELLRLINRVF